MVKHNHPRGKTQSCTGTQLVPVDFSDRRSIEKPQRTLVNRTSHKLLKPSLRVVYMYSNQTVDPTTTAFQVEHERPRRHVEVNAVLVAGKIRFVIQIYLTPVTTPTTSVPTLHWVAQW